MPESEGLHRRILDQFQSSCVAEFIADCGHDEMLAWLDVAPTFEPDHVESCLGKLSCHDAAGPAHADHDRIDFLQACDHFSLPSRKICDRLRFHDVTLVAVLSDEIPVNRWQAR